MSRPRASGSVAQMQRWLPPYLTLRATVVHLLQSEAKGDHRSSKLSGIRWRISIYLYIYIYIAICISIHIFTLIFWLKLLEIPFFRVFM